MVGIVDYRMGNLGSVANMLKRIGVEATITSEAADLDQADKLILPGVGAFDSGMNNLGMLGLVPVLNQQVLERGKPVLGICLGMQLMARSSEEGNLTGLGWMDAQAVKFASNGHTGLRIPHMGWNTLSPKRECPLLHDMPDDSRFYFVHSYHTVFENQEDVSAVTHYGCDFASVVHKRNLYGVQFHPEKSLRFGMKILQNFVKL